ncbi:MAG: TonB-dependent receptor [candidate division KSB1 bacterium]|nr:TonB-dependent receptor [candidate division KSB1 bacterium]MDZ7276551.1 TonB-dependent receptor [candidate division KSB1 bacterium]MDZ7285030.1 TonB-dependent receptor [candidate division KSB1 bacterium]MDZ7298062.1 TonB-dependent receptor [candidate division KSB1 bacterium]MDZ7307450.1 TonB-dependent receptor [candidate division KSB1 bacterium]
MKKIIRRSFAGVLVLLLSGGLLFAGTTGKIAGRVIDKQTGEPLAGASVMIVGTTLGAAADASGYYFILQVPPGTYSVRATVIGFEPLTVTKVKVAADLTTKIDFALSPTVLQLTEGMTVVAERPIIEKDVTFSSHRMTADRIANMPTVSDVRDLVARQPGVVGEGLHINVRGGRTGEMLYVVDGVASHDPHFKQATRTTAEQVGQFTSNPVDELTARSGGLSVPANAISEVEVITGGFNAEYGNAMSGIVNVVTKEGGAQHTGRVVYLTDDFGIGRFKTPYGNGTQLRTYSHNSDRLELSFGGPEPITTHLLPRLGIKLPVREITYFVAGSGYFTDLTTAFDLAYYAPTGEDRSEEIRELNLLGLNLLRLGLPNRMDNHYNSLANVSVRFSPRMKLVYSYQTDRSYYDEYNHAFSRIPENFWQRDEHSFGHSLKWTHTLSEKTFYDLVLSYSDLDYRLTPGGLLPPEVRQLYLDLGGVTARDDDQDGFYEAGFPARGTYHHRNTKTSSLKMDLTSQVHRRHQLKTGLEVAYYEMFLAEIKYPYRYNERWDPEAGGTPIDDGPWPALGAFRDFYTRTPTNAAFYVQDKIEYESLIVNVGMRWDLWTPGAQVEDDVDEGTNLFGRKFKITFNPRLGISHPITDKDILYFQFGRFTQQVDYQFLFIQDTQSSGALQLLGNPNLGSEETTQYELGVKHAFGDEVRVGATAFFKDYNGLLNTETRGREPFTYSVYINRDFGSARGLEFSLEKRYSHFTSGFINYTLAYATGKSSSYRQGYDYGARGQPIPIREWPLDWDVRHSLNVNFDFRVNSGARPSLFGVRLPPEMGVNVVWRFESGKPYTPTGRSSDQYTTRNSARLPYRTWVDVRANKDFRYGGLKTSLLLEIKNLTNRRNARAIYAETGQVLAFYRPQDLNPSAFTAGRNVLLGLAVEW